LVSYGVSHCGSGPASRRLGKPCFKEGELELLFLNQSKADTRIEGYGKCLLLEPDWRHGLIPALTFRYNFDRSLPETRFQVALFTMDNESNLRAIGYRFETPEGVSCLGLRESAHHYYHAQLITRFNDQQLPCPEWLPMKQPAFALDACDSVTLITSLLISLYGIRFVTELESSDFWSSLQQYVMNERMTCLRPEFRPSYWRMRVEGVERYTKTWRDKAKFKIDRRLYYKATDITEISEETFLAQSEELMEID
jgi:hypothetical protein